jgi:hypothetical protein
VSAAWKVQTRKGRKFGGVGWGTAEAEEATEARGKVGKRDGKWRGPMAWPGAGPRGGSSAPQSRDRYVRWESDGGYCLPRPGP